MKKFIYFLNITLFLALPSLAQNEGISFQGLARNASGEVLVSQKISLRLSILLDSESGPVAYMETRQVTTNPQGIFAVVLGDANALTKSTNFSTINWTAAPKFIKVEMDSNAGTNFTAMGTSKLQPVPFAFYAYGVDAENIKGTLPVSSGGTGVASIAELKASLGVDQVNNTTDASKPISSATQGALATKVDKVTGKDLSTNDYSTAEKTKLAAIAGTNTGDQDLRSYATSVQLATKVDKEAGKGLSSNDFTIAEKNKLAAITGNVAGPQGPAGVTGATGPAGASGPQGLPGLPGVAGTAGSTGPAGPQGLQGVAGVEGPIGPTGATGPIGPAGLTWKGVWSATGVYAKDDAVGFNGASYFCLAPVSNSSATPTSDPTNWALLASQGAIGLQGPTGPRGVSGATGPTGPTGPGGPQGTQGLTGPTGVTGPAGVQGVAGPIGPAGLTWKGAWSATDAYVKDDVVGFNGASYFCLAPVSNSSTTPTSDPTKWALLASQGVDGPQGPTGAAGATGPQGPIGLTGPQGPTGAAGAQGLAGSDGATGPAGATGPQGSNGMTGPAGAQGLPGTNGTNGVAGPQGPIGLTGPAGPQGAIGPAGTNGVSASSANFVDLTTDQTIAGVKTFSGKIGMGTSTPSAKFEIVGGTRNDMLRLVSDGNPSVSFKNTDPSGGAANDGEYQLFAAGNSGNPSINPGTFGIYYDHSSNAGYRMAITNTGNVGVGTAKPTEKLDVVGNLKTSGTIKAGTITYPNTAGTNGYYLKTDGTGTASWAAVSGGGVPYTGATSGVNLGGYDLTVNDLTIGSGKVGASGSNSNTIVGGAGVSRAFTTVLSNTAIGYNTMSAAIPGNNNTAVGAYSLVSTTGRENAVLGAAALERNLGGNGNTAIGYYSLRNNTAGANNTALGHNSLIIDPPGSNNTVIGASADLGVSNLTNATAIGYQAKVAASNTIQLGADGTNSTTAITNVKTSGTLTAGTVTYPNAHNSTAGQVLTINNAGTASWASASSSSGVPYTGATQAVNLGGYDLTVNGVTIGSGKINSTATLNTIIGEYALNRSNTSRGTDNTAIGYKSMGNETLSSSSAGTKNTAVGSWTLINSTGQENSVLGVAAMEQNQNGSQNTAMGGRALTANSTGSNNTAVGYNSLKSNSSGTKNTTIGSEANVASGTLTNATALGYGAIVSANNTIQLGADGTNSTTAISNVKTSGTLTAGTVTYPNAHGSANQVLSTTGSGTLAWTTPAASPAHYIGEAYGGGIVFYVWDNGAHGLIAATTDQGVVRWGVDLTSTRARGDGVGAGLTNTAIIIAKQGTIDTNLIAASLANEYSVTSGGVVYGGWYLPSKHELQLLFNQKSILTGLIGSWYFSSTETSDGAGAWLISVNGSSSSWWPNDKREAWSVRAIRAF